MSFSDLIIFSTYWVTTILTTVGYGDYAGSNSLEYCFTMFVEIFGPVLYAALTSVVIRVKETDTNFQSYVSRLQT